MSSTAESISKAASAVQYSGPAVMIGAATKQYFGFSLDEWSVIGVIFGIVLGLVGYLTKHSIDFYFAWKEDRRRQAESESRMRIASILRDSKHAALEEGRVP